MSYQYSIHNYIGQTVRRCVFILKRKDGVCYHLFSLIEHLTEDMQDVDAFSPNTATLYVDFNKKAKGNKSKVFLKIDYVILTEDMIRKPWEHICVGKDIVMAESEEYEWWTGDAFTSNIIPVHCDEKNELCAILPRRHCAAFVNVCKPKEPETAVEEVFGSAHLLKQMKDLSERNLGYDLTKHRNFLGAFVFVAYNPIYREIDFTEDGESPGLYIRVNYREGRHDTIYFAIKGLDNHNNILFNRLVHTEEGIFLYHVSFEKPFQHLEVTVYDKDGNEIDYYPYVFFVRTFQLHTQVKSKELVITDKTGKAVKTVEKFVEGKPMIIGRKPQTDSLWDTSDEFAYEKLEKSLDFVFFEGCNEPKIQAEVRKKAKACIMRILDSAHRVCYICDTFFDPNAFRDFIWDMQSLSIEVRIISSKADLTAGRKTELKALIDEYNGKLGAKLSCRLLRGKASILHDRFIVADENVWMLGCSLNMFADKATTLIRVPQDYRKKLVDMAEEWWNSEDYSEAL